MNGVLYFLRPIKNVNRCMASSMSSMKIRPGGQKNVAGAVKCKRNII